VRLVVDVDVSGPLAQLGGMRQRAENTRALMGILATGLEDYERTMFATSGEGTWAPDDVDTLEQKGGGRTLVDEGRLMRQLTTARIVGESAIVDQGTAFYGSFLRDGDRGMPRRNPAPAPQRRHVDRWADQVLGYITTGRLR
jgi:phage gpG-like protein